MKSYITKAEIYGNYYDAPLNSSLSSPQSTAKIQAAINKSMNKYSPQIIKTSASDWIHGGTDSPKAQDKVKVQTSGGRQVTTTPPPSTNNDEGPDISKFVAEHWKVIAVAGGGAVLLLLLMTRL